MSEFLVQLFNAFGPLVLQLIQQWQADHNTTELPTMAQLEASYHATIASYLAEGAAWRATHPDA